MLEILLVWTMSHVDTPDVLAGPFVSERVFGSYQECAALVAMIAGPFSIDQQWQFRIESEGQIFQGQCIRRQDYESENS